MNAGLEVPLHPTGPGALDALRFRTLMESDLCGLFVADERSIYEANDAFLRLVGYSREDVAADRLVWEALNPVDYADADQRAVDELARTGRCTPYEKEFVTRDGARVPVVVAAARIDGSRRDIVCIVTDLTGQRRREERERFLVAAGDVLSGALDGDTALGGVAHLIAASMADWCLVLVQEERQGAVQVAEAHIDPAREALLRSIGRSRRPGDDLGGALGRVLRTGSSETLEGGARLAADPAIRAVLAELAPRRVLVVPMIAAGRIVGAIALGRGPGWSELAPLDVACVEDLASRAAAVVERARLYREAREAIARLREAERALQEADRAKDRFLAMLCHELKSPLSAARMAVEELKEDESLSEDAASLLGIVDRQSRTMSRLVEDLMDISRIVRGKASLRRDVVTLESVVSASTAASHKLVNGRGHALTVTLPPEPVRIDVDPDRLTQVLTNLLNNAAKYTPPNGRIWLEATAEGCDLFLRVRDNGIGMSEALRARAFEMFVQAENVERMSKGGLGIGLALVRGLVEMHGGTVAVHSEGQGRGSEFVVHLPDLVHRAEDPAGPCAGPASPPPGGDELARGE